MKQTNYDKLKQAARDMKAKEIREHQYHKFILARPPGI